MNRLLRRRWDGNTASATYCYGVWLKHLTLLGARGLPAIPESLAELGPGESLGIGLAALLSGVQRYYAFDIVAHADIQCNLTLLDELVELFHARAPRPTKGWPDFDDYLDERLFPHHLLPDSLLETTLHPQRLNAIREALCCLNTADAPMSITYVTPWSDPNVIVEASVQLILSHAVLEHVDDLNHTYRSCFAWLSPGGVMSHQIDFTSHGLTKAWNGYWAYSDATWKFLVGRRPYLINRQPCSVHTRLLQQHGFTILWQLNRHQQDGLRRDQLAPRWRDLSDEDFTCRGTFLHVQKPLATG